MHFARPYDLKAGTLGDRLRAVHPTLFLGVPRVWEKIQEKIMAKAAQNPTTGIKNSLKLWALGLGLEHQENCQLGGSGEYGTGYAIAEKLVLSKVKLLLGLDQCKFCFTGAAPIKTETLQFYGRLGLNINEVYGMSECTGATTWSTDLAHRWGSCGWAVPSTEVSVRSKSSNEEVLDGNEGEICYRGRHIMMGYMANPGKCGCWLWCVTCLKISSFFFNRFFIVTFLLHVPYYHLFHHFSVLRFGRRTHAINHL